MMMTAEELRRKLSSVDIAAIAAKSVRQTSSDLVEWQREQLFSGKNSSGSNIKPFYKPATISKKKKAGQPTDRVTLNDKGDFYAGVIVDIGTEVWNLSSTDSKSGKLEAKYSPKIFGLNKISTAGYATDVRPKFLKNLQEATGLKIL
jgi:hypothetical protein